MDGWMYKMSVFNYSLIYSVCIFNVTLYYIYFNLHYMVNKLINLNFMLLNVQTLISFNGCFYEFTGP